MPRPPLTLRQSQCIAWKLTRQAGGDTVAPLASTLVASQVDLNPVINPGYNAEQLFGGAE